jgi:Holliday junction resolvase
MPNLNYIRGRALEYRVMKEYKREGYEVFRSAGSHSKADVIAVKKWLYGDECYEGSRVTLIQCKTGSKLMSKKDTIEFREYAKELGCEAVLAYRIGKTLIFDSIRKHESS